MDELKPFWRSRTLWGSIVAVLALLAEAWPTLEAVATGFAPRYAFIERLEVWIAFAGVALVMFARWDDRRKGRR